MIVYGYVKDVKYGGDGTMYVQVRVPNIHGPNSRQAYKGNQVRNYVTDNRLPYYQANLLSSIPVVDDVVELRSHNESSTEFVVTGLTGGSYLSNMTNKGE